MGYGTHRVPDPLQDEDKWFHLTKRQIVMALVALLIVIGVISLSWTLRILPIGIFLSTLIIILTGAFLLVDIPEDKYLYGSGNKLEKIALRLLMKRLPWNKTLYTKNLDNGIERWKEK